jgi:hypothetical protein
MKAILFDGLSLADDAGDEEAADDDVEFVNAKSEAFDRRGISATPSRLTSVAFVNLIFQLFPIEGSRISPNCW